MHRSSLRYPKRLRCPVHARAPNSNGRSLPCDTRTPVVIFTLIIKTPTKPVHTTNMSCRKMEIGESIPQRPGCTQVTVGPPTQYWEPRPSYYLCGPDLSSDCVADCPDEFHETVDGYVSCGFIPEWMRDGQYRAGLHPASKDDIPINQVNPVVREPISLSNGQTVTLQRANDVRIQDDRYPYWDDNPVMDPLFRETAGFFEFRTGSDVKEYRICSMSETFTNCASRDAPRYTCVPGEMGAINCTAVESGTTDGGGGKQ